MNTDCLQEIFYHVDFNTYSELSCCNTYTYAISYNYLYTIPSGVCHYMHNEGRLREYVLRRNIIYIDLGYAWDFTDASFLAGIQMVNISNTKVTDVSMLGGCHFIDISGTDVCNVSALGRCNTVLLRDTQVCDVSMLTRCSKVDVSFSNVTDTSMFGDHTEVICDKPVKNTTDWGIGNCHTLDLRNVQLTDVSALGKCHTLYLNNMRPLTADEIWNPPTNLESDTDDAWYQTWDACREPDDDLL